MEKFSVLPSDERFLSLEEEQKYALFEGISSLPDERIIKKRVLLFDRLVEFEKRELETFATPGLLKRMREGMKAEGLSDILIEQRVKMNLENIKALEIRKIKEELDG